MPTASDGSSAKSGAAGAEPGGAAERGRARLPEAGRSREELRQALAAARAADADWRRGRTWSLVYYAGEEALAVIQDAYLAFFSENGLGPRAFPSLKRFEEEVLAMTAGLLHGEQAVGSLTSGGSESILMAVKTARDRARAERPEVTTPEMVLPVTAHPAFNKAAHYFGLKAVRTPVGDDFRADVAAMARAVTDDTVLLVGSAPGYPHGVIDPIPEMARLAEACGASFHVDACLGGFVLPFLERLGYPVRPFDFRVPGVTSISADVHKYGFGAKGASVILYREPGVFAYQPFAFDDWPIGEYRSPGMTGTRPGGAIAAAWAAMQYFGVAGYTRLAETVMRTTRALIGGINRIPGLEVWGEPDMSVFAYGSRTLDIYAVADGMSARGWYVNRQAVPPAIHLVVTPAHEPIVETYLRDLEETAGRVARGELRSRGITPGYA